MKLLSRELSNPVSPRSHLTTLFALLFKKKTMRDGIACNYSKENFKYSAVTNCLSSCIQLHCLWLLQLCHPQHSPVLPEEWCWHYQKQHFLFCFLLCFIFLKNFLWPFQNIAATALSIPGVAPVLIQICTFQPNKRTNNWKNSCLSINGVVFDLTPDIVEPS